MPASSSSERGDPRSTPRVAAARERRRARTGERPKPAAEPPTRTAEAVTAAAPGSGAPAPGRPEPRTAAGPVPPRAAGPTSAPPAAGAPDRPDGRTSQSPELVPVTPVRRLLSFVLAAFSGLLAVGLIFGAQTAGLGIDRLPYAIVVLGIQVLYVLAFTMALRPPGVVVVATVGLGCAVAANLAAILPAEATVAPLGYVAAAGFIAGVVGQLVRREGRLRMTESLGASLIVVVGVIALATLIVLTRQPIGTQAITVCLAATGVALVVARLVDTVAPWPRLAPQVPRGALGVVLGAMAGTVAAAVLGGYIRGFSPSTAALVGLAAAVGAVLADLSVGYAEAGRQPHGEPPTMWIARHLQGPLAGFALAAPLAYGMSVAFFVHRF